MAGPTSTDGQSGRANLYLPFVQPTGKFVQPVLLLLSLFGWHLASCHWGCCGSATCWPQKLLNIAVSNDLPTKAVLKDLLTKAVSVCAEHFKPCLGLWLPVNISPSAVCCTCRGCQVRSSGRLWQPEHDRPGMGLRSNRIQGDSS